MRCPHFATCNYETEEADLEVVAALLVLHNHHHVVAAQQANIKKPDQLEVVKDMYKIGWSEFCFNWEDTKGIIG